ncbi:MAG: class I SAM-dependent methyltransferase [Acidimicrobiales bacterium]
MPSSPIDDLRSYYETEARLGRRTAPKGFRTEWRAAFVALLIAEHRRSVLDFGAGPGLDAGPFHDAGMHYVGLDLAHGNARIARAADAVVVQGSMSAPPFRPASFGAGWSMSTLMHVPESEVEDTVHAMVGVLEPEAPLLIGLWGGDRRDEIDVEQIAGERRLFSLRPFDRNRELVAVGGTVERVERLEVGPEGWEYHGFLLRAHPSHG